MLAALSGFLDRLRARGVPVSPAEAVDAAAALAALGVESRPAAAAALALTCVKERSRLAAFHEEFERYFAPPARIGRRGLGVAEPGESGGGRGGDGTSLVTPSGRTLAPRAAPQAAVARPASRPAARRGERRSVPGELSRQLVERAGRRTGRLQRVLLPRPLRPRDAVPAARRRPLTGRHDAASDERLLAEAARALAELRLRAGRRRRAARAGTIELRRTLRRSLRTGGVPFALARSRRRRRRPKIIVLLDVSHSVERAAGLFARLALEILAETGATTVFAFVDRPIECTRALAAWSRGGHRQPAGTGAGFTGFLAAVSALDLALPSDYGRVFFALAAHRALGGSGRDRVVVVLGDGRTNRFDPQAWAFADIARRARSVVWLVPEPAARWGSGDSALGAYLPEADVAVEASDLQGLIRGLRTILRELPA